MLLKLKELLLELNTLTFMSVFYKNNLTMVSLLEKYEKSSVIPEDMCTKPCSGPIISQSTKGITVFGFYLNSDTKHYQIMISH